MDYQCTQPSEIEICRQAEEIERQREIKERNRVHEETMQMLREMIKIQEEKRIFEEAARREEEKWIAKEKEAAELEAKCKIQKCLNIEEKSIPQASTRSRKFQIDPTLRNFTISTKRVPFLTDDSIPLRDIIARYSSSVVITSSPPVLPTREPEDSLIMGDEHLDIIPEKESEKLIKSSVENLCDETSPTFTTFSNPLFDLNDYFTSCDDESLSDEDIPMENFKIYSNPLFDDEEIISPKIDPHYFNAKSNLIESLLNRDILIDSSPKFDYLLEEFSGDLAHIDPILPGIEKADFDLEEEIRHVEKLLYDNSSPRPPKELNLEIADMIFKSLSPSPILVEDSDSLMDEIGLFLASNDLMPPGTEDDDYDSEGDIRFLEELLNNDSLPLPENESYDLDHFINPSPSRPPPKPSDVEFRFNFKPDMGVVTNKVMGDISEHDVFMPNLLPT
ncbi:hypothetical protein Tco_1030396 [Tanacetum coccineum]|uniref:Uncharacterized protein n=1 Tax=Tanacetum coccineum TaxID=301880 RepID=A0ABQ5G6J2_9ASTR